MNIAEIELSHLSRQCLNRRIPDQETFIHETNAWCKRRNESNATVDWQFTTDDARIKLKVRHESARPLVAESATGKAQPSAFRT